MSAVPTTLLRGCRALAYAVFASLAVLLLALAAAPAHAAAPDLQILSSGTGDKVQLRFKPKVGTTQTVDFVMTMSMKMSGVMPMDMELPGMRMSMKTTVVNVAENGDITYNLEVIGAGVDGEADPAVKAQLESQIQSMVGTEAVITTDSRGNTKSADFTPPPGAPPELVDNLQKSMDGSSANLPVEAVGKGARWQLKQEIRENGIAVDQVTTYEVAELTDTGVTLAIDIKQSAETGPMDDPNLPPGATATINKFAGQGNGTSRFAFDQPMVVDADLSITVESSIEMSMQGQTQSMDMTMGMSTVIRPRAK